jgi:hypothetical protein
MSRMAGAGQCVGVTIPSAWFEAKRRVRGDRPLGRMAPGTHAQKLFKTEGRCAHVVAAGLGHDVQASLH